MAERCAVVGVGQTHHRKIRDDVSMAGLVREAAERALEDAEMRWADIDAIVMGTAPDMFEGLVQPELYMADALGAAGKPIMRVHTAGSVGGSTAVVAAHHIQAGVHERVLTLGWEKQSDGTCRAWISEYDGRHRFNPEMQNRIRQEYAFQVISRQQRAAGRSVERQRLPNGEIEVLIGNYR